MTPSSKVVGDLALFMVTNGLTTDEVLSAQTPLHFPQSVVEMMQGMLGQPEGGWPRAVSGDRASLRTRAADRGPAGCVDAAGRFRGGRP